MEQKGLREHGQFRGAKFVLTVMTNDEVLNEDFQFVGKAGNLSDFSMQHFQFNDHVAKQLAFGCIGKRPVVGKFVDFADVVQKSAGEKQVAVDLRIVLTDQVTGTGERDHMVEQPTDIGVMQSLGRGSI